MNWHSLAEISKLTRIPAPTARRYALLFREFLPNRRVGRTTRYSDESVALFQRINNAYQAGRLTHEIEEELRQDLPRTFEVTQEALAQPLQPQVQVQSFDPVLMRTVTDLLDRFGKSLEILANQKALIEHQRQDIQRLKAAFVQLAQNQKRLKQLPRALIRPVALDQERRCQVLAQKDAELETTTHQLMADQGEISSKLKVLESEIVRLRKDRRELERYLLGKISLAQSGGRERS